jgi:hypothetical protein
MAARHRSFSSAIFFVVVSLTTFPFLVWFWVASADATLAFAENGGLQTESKTSEIFWPFLARRAGIGVPQEADIHGSPALRNS